ncbi:ead/Ea22-like family protein [Salmonella enterica]|nr:ead/Ea22-like family protein [Salmonella enterica]ECS7337551.1 ead/Ea22-like family protein [Salmonella enterica subsp. enterica serovar Berta]EDR6094257.1 ead/Ea22-like family protein [Salmonella enterica subsp. enterica serovar Java]EEB5867768.1 ead/Ea22-like family protein [Salmonella enterica subsp. enterica serovar Montevideo]EAS5328467.1 ead/Ea22-like family protein [Salmonella enterica]
MSYIDKQALREEFRYMRDHYNDPADRKKQEIYIAAEALLDELDKKQQYIKLRDQENEDIALTVGKLRVELEAAKKRIAELEKGHQEAAKQINSWRRLAKQNIAERGKDISELEAARQRIAELEARTVNLSKLSVGEVMHLSGFSRDYAEGWCAGNDNAIHEIRAAGIKVKES